MTLFERWAGSAVKLTDGNFWRGFFGMDTPSGQVVTIDSALSLDAVWACVNLVSKTVGTLPCQVYERDGSTIASDAPLYALLHDLPNENDTAPEFWEMAALSLLLDGNFFAEKKMLGARLIALIPLYPMNVNVGRNDKNERVYTLSIGGKERKIPADRMFHIRGVRIPGSDRGMSPIGVVRNTIGNALAAERTAGKMFASGMQVSGILSSDQILKPEQRKQLGATLGQFSGSEKAGKIAVLEAGLKYQALTINPQDAQMLETRQFSVEQICRIFGVPPIMVNHAATGVTTWGSGVEQIILQFTKTGLRPMLKSIEAAIYRDLMDLEARKNLKVEFNMEGLLRGDSKTRMEFLTGMVGAGIYTHNEARAYENKPPIDGGDRLLANAAMTPLNMLGIAPLKAEAKDKQ